MLPVTEREAVRIELEGPIASFRYPHFLIARQPSFAMPPPSTIYGLAAAALGNFPDPDRLEFSYIFTCERRRTDDLGKFWKATPNRATRGASRGRNLEVESDVLKRELLIRPRLRLYFMGEATPALYGAFRVPRYALALGRSQELVSVRRVDRVVLTRAREGLLGLTLLPLSLRDRIPRAAAVHMPRFIQPHDRRQVVWRWYLALEEALPAGSQGYLQLEASDEWWADPATDDRGITRRQPILVFHTFTDRNASD